MLKKIKLLLGLGLNVNTGRFNYITIAIGQCVSKSVINLIFVQANEKMKRDAWKKEWRRYYGSCKSGYKSFVDSVKENPDYQKLNDDKKKLFLSEEKKLYNERSCSEPHREKFLETIMPSLDYQNKKGNTLLHILFDTKQRLYDLSSKEQRQWIFPFLDRAANLVLKKTTKNHFEVRNNAGRTVIQEAEYQRDLLIKLMAIKRNIAAESFDTDNNFDGKKWFAGWVDYLTKNEAENKSAKFIVKRCEWEIDNFEKRPLPQLKENIAKLRDNKKYEKVVRQFDQGISLVKTSFEKLSS